ncbi:thiamine diphosphokinase [Mycoplasma sp. P36-A1]|uniref:thiamine diphosphokinase n=1 Tax=Mycoplasma sp. P36-A1 TaxID=3252900 RepID=UPI003C2C41F5
MMSNKSVNIVASIPYSLEYEKGDFIGVDQGCRYLIDKNIDINLAIGDFDSLEKNYLDILSANNTKIVKLNPHKDYTDLECAIIEAYKLKYNHVNVYGAIGKRIDHSLININLLKKYRNLNFYDDYSIIKVITSTRTSLDNYASKYKYFSFFNIEDNTIITLKNFEYPLNDYLLKSDDTLCISNEILNNSEIITNKDIIMVASR